MKGLPGESQLWYAAGFAQLQLADTAAAARSFQCALEHVTLCSEQAEYRLQLEVAQARGRY